MLAVLNRVYANLRSSVGYAPRLDFSLTGLSVKIGKCSIVSAY